jgi:hypothetical protein
MPRYSKEEIQESREFLRKALPSGYDRIHRPRHVSRSGLLREISLFVIHKGAPISITWHAARVLRWSVNDGRAYWALRVSGCGMDMGFHTVNSLSYAVHGMKSKGEGANADGGFRPRPGHFHAGYSLRQEWL